MKKVTLSLMLTGFSLFVLGCALVASSPVVATAQQSSNVPAYMQNAWLCLNNSAARVDDLNTPGRSENNQCSLSVRYDATTAIVTSNGVPNHDYWSGASANIERSQTWYIPLAPAPDTDGQLTYVPERGPIAIMASGIAIFGAEDADGGDVVALNNGYFRTNGPAPQLGVCGAHATADGFFHYHYDGNCVHWHPAAGQDSSNYSFSKVDSIRHSEVIGFAFDGYPIYGTYGFDRQGNVKEMTSSYRLRANGGNGANGNDDWEYVSGLGDLDQCNGHVGPTPESPQGIYHYHSTMHNGQGRIGFPYFPLCYHGVVDSRNLQTPGGPGGVPPR